MKSKGVVFVCIGITVLAVLIAISASLTVSSLRHLLAERDRLIASLQKPPPKTSATGQEVTGNDLIAWKLAYGTAVGSWYSGVFPPKPIRNLITRNENGYIFLFSNLNQPMPLTGDSIPMAAHSVFEVVVMDYGDKLQVVSGKTVYCAPDRYDELFGTYLREPKK